MRQWAKGLLFCIRKSWTKIVMLWCFFLRLLWGKVFLQTLHVAQVRKSRWWQLKYFLCSPRTLGKMNPFWRAYFSNGLVQPPTRNALGCFFFALASFLVSSAMDLRTEDVTQLNRKSGGSEEGERPQLCCSGCTGKVVSVSIYRSIYLSIYLAI